MSGFSALARPPVQPQEAESADTAICPYHNGLIRETGEREGRVLFCPIGRQYWRYTRNPGSGFASPLPYQNAGVV